MFYDAPYGIYEKIPVGLELTDSKNPNNNNNNSTIYRLTDGYSKLRLNDLLSRRDFTHALIC
jgi:hypothetical protein